MSLDQEFPPPASPAQLPPVPQAPSAPALPPAMPSRPQAPGPEAATSTSIGSQQFVPVAAPRRSSGGLKVFTLVMLLIFGGLGTAAYLGYQHTQKESAKDDVADGSTPSVPLDGTATSTTVVAAPAGAGVPTPLDELPEINLPRPTFRVAKWIQTDESVGANAGARFEHTLTTTMEADFGAAIALAHLEQTGSTALSFEVILTGDATYTPGDTFGAPWTRRPRTPSATAMDSPDQLMTYAEVVTSALRATATGITQVSENINGIDVTTYRFSADWTTLPAFASAEFDSEFDSARPLLRPELFAAQITLSVDAQGLFRVYDVRMDKVAFGEALGALGGERWMPVHLRTEILLTSDTPTTIVPPTNFVDAPPEAEG